MRRLHGSGRWRTGVFVPYADFASGGKKITTLEGLGTLAEPAPIQCAFIEAQAAQCGYCIPGMMMRAQALLQKKPQASEAEIRAWLEPNLCRCGTHMRILRAIRGAQSMMSTAQTGDRT
jgi:nicotinate dehydrogenase subunit A